MLCISLNQNHMFTIKCQNCGFRTTVGYTLVFPLRFPQIAPQHPWRHTVTALYECDVTERMNWMESNVKKRDSKSCLRIWRKRLIHRDDILYECKIWIKQPLWLTESELSKLNEQYRWSCCCSPSCKATKSKQIKSDFNSPNFSKVADSGYLYIYTYILWKPKFPWPQLRKIWK